MLWQKIAIAIRYFEEDFKIILFTWVIHATEGSPAFMCAQKMSAIVHYI